MCRPYIQNTKKTSSLCVPTEHEKDRILVCTYRTRTRPHPYVYFRTEKDLTIICTTEHGKKKPSSVAKELMMNLGVEEK
jgi:hypothetical protein